MVAPGLSRSAILITSFLLWLTALAAPSHGTEDTLRGPFAVGVREFRIAGTQDFPAMSTTIWYPATGAARDSDDASADAPAATTGPYPLVLVIHGLSGTGDMFGSVGRRFAAHGFVVAAANYDTGPSGEGKSQQDRQMVWLLYNRPANALRVIAYVDALNAPGRELAGIVDSSRIGVWGLSTGGTTAFQAAGAQIDLKALDTWCAVHKGDNYAYETCQFVGHEQAIATRYGVSEPFAAPLPPLWDQRVAALVATSPGGELHALGDAGIAAVKVPTLVMFASDDKVVLPEFNAIWAYDGIGSQDKALTRFDRGGHTLFMNPWSPHFSEATALATSFFLAILRDSPADRAMLRQNTVSTAGVSYKSTLR